MTETFYHSRLWKSAMLAEETSTYFPPLVRAAALFLGKEYTEGMLHAVAANTDLVDALTVPTTSTVDLALQAYASDPETALIMDGLIVAAVQAYEPPPPAGGAS